MPELDLPLPGPEPAPGPSREGAAGAGRAALVEFGGQSDPQAPGDLGLAAVAEAPHVAGQPPGGAPRGARRLHAAARAGGPAQSAEGAARLHQQAQGASVFLRARKRIERRGRRPRRAAGGAVAQARGPRREPAGHLGAGAARHAAAGRAAGHRLERRRAGRPPAAAAAARRAVADRDPVLRRGPSPRPCLRRRAEGQSAGGLLHGAGGAHRAVGGPDPDVPREPPGCGRAVHLRPRKRMVSPGPRTPLERH
mmetsp:Transcript_55932/g.160688  ORF Transcript_55932/g.160688 Transcript_55932/m.160688 type:complete len:252 (-) Transcript_55932:589-1344(-)